MIFEVREVRRRLQPLSTVRYRFPLVKVEDHYWTSALTRYSLKEDQIPSKGSRKKSKKVCKYFLDWRKNMPTFEIDIR